MLETTDQARNPGAIMESDMNFSSHIKTVTKSAYYHLKNISRIRGPMSRQDLEKLPKNSVRQLQLFHTKYIYDLLPRYEPFRPLRSSGTGLFSVPRVRTNNGAATFSYYAPHMWNKLPENCSSAPTLTSFKLRLKTFLFATALN